MISAQSYLLPPNVVPQENLLDHPLLGRSDELIAAVIKDRRESLSANMFKEKLPARKVAYSQDRLSRGVVQVTSRIFDLSNRRYVELASPLYTQPNSEQLLSEEARSAATTPIESLPNQNQKFREWCQKILDGESIFFGNQGIGDYKIGVSNESSLMRINQLEENVVLYVDAKESKRFFRDALQALQQYSYAGKQEYGKMYQKFFCEYQNIKKPIHWLSCSQANLEDISKSRMSWINILKKQETNVTKLIKSLRSGFKDNADLKESFSDQFFAIKQMDMDFEDSNKLSVSLIDMLTKRQKIINKSVGDYPLEKGLWENYSRITADMVERRSCYLQKFLSIAIQVRSLYREGLELITVG